MRRNWSGHGYKSEVSIYEMLSAWIEKHMEVVGSALHLDERLVMRQIPSWQGRRVTAAAHSLPTPCCKQSLRTFPLGELDV